MLELNLIKAISFNCEFELYCGCLEQHNVIYNKYYIFINKINNQLVTDIHFESLKGV